MKTKAPKKEVLSLRIEPKLRYLIDLAARIQRRNLTNYVEWALEESLKNVILEHHDGAIENLSLYNAGNIPNFIWSANEARNFLTLATSYRNLLTYEEQRVLEIIQSLPYVFCINPNKPFDYENGNVDNVTKYWDLVLQAHKEGAPTKKSPSYEKLITINQAHQEEREALMSEIDEMKAKVYHRKDLKPALEFLSSDEELAILNTARKILTRRTYLESTAPPSESEKDKEK